MPEHPDVTQIRRTHEIFKQQNLISCARCADSGVELLAGDFSAGWYGPCRECKEGGRINAHLLLHYTNTLRKSYLKWLPYIEYLETPEWQKRRQGALQAAEHRCQVCNTSGLLDVHHRTYERRGEELDADLIVLCRNCHAKFHDKLPDVIP